jgi:hypothetical protein
MLVPVERIETSYFVELDRLHYLVRSQSAEHLRNFVQTGQGAYAPVYLRYAFLQYGTLRPFFPAMVADDWGKLWRGLECIDWLASNGLLYPRSDVSGLWYDGSDDQFVIKELDLALSYSIYASTSESDFPGQLISAALEIVESAAFGLAPGGNFPARLSSAIPTFQLNAALPFSKTVPLLPQAIASPHVIDLDSIV